MTVLAVVAVAVDVVAVDVKLSWLLLSMSWLSLCDCCRRSHCRCYCNLPSVTISHRSMPNDHMSLFVVYKSSKIDSNAIQRIGRGVCGVGGSLKREKP